MDSLSLLKAWLSHKDYLEGVRLYLKFGQDHKLKQLFTSEKETPFKKQRLEKAIRDLLNAAPIHTNKTTTVPAPIQPVSKSWTAESCKDDLEKAIREDWLQQFKTMQDLRSQLMLIGTDQERGEVAHKILDLDEQCDKLLAKRDYYREHGALPSEEPVELITDPLAMVKRMTLLDRYIRRERQNMRNNPANHNAAGRLQKFIKEYNEYAERFGKDRISE